MRWACGTLKRANATRWAACIQAAALVHDLGEQHVAASLGHMKHDPLAKLPPRQHLHTALPAGAKTTPKRRSKAYLIRCGVEFWKVGDSSALLICVQLGRFDAGRG